MEQETSIKMKSHSARCIIAKWDKMINYKHRKREWKGKNKHSLNSLSVRNEAASRGPSPEKGKFDFGCENAPVMFGLGQAGVGYVAVLQAESRLDDPNGIGQHQRSDAGLGRRQHVQRWTQRYGRVAVLHL